MNTTDPSDLAPLSYGPGLAFGLFLLLGLPTEPRKAPISAPLPPVSKLHSVGRESSGVTLPPREQSPKRRTTRPIAVSRN